MISKKLLSRSFNLFDGEDDEPIGDDNDELPTTEPPYCQPGDFQCLDELDDRNHGV